MKLQIRLGLYVNYKTVTVSLPGFNNLSQSSEVANVNEDDKSDQNDAFQNTKFQNFLQALQPW